MPAVAQAQSLLAARPREDLAVMIDERFKLLVEREGDSLLRLAVRLAGEADGPDVLQEALVKAWVALQSGTIPDDGSRATARWLVRVVVNQAYDAVRARTRRRRWSTIFAVVLPSFAPGAADTASEAARVERYLDVLTADQRVAWVLREVEGYSQAEIAQLVGASEGAVEQRLLRARTTLARSLRDAP